MPTCQQKDCSLEWHRRVVVAAAASNDSSSSLVLGPEAWIQRLHPISEADFWCDLAKITRALLDPCSPDIKACR